MYAATEDGYEQEPMPVLYGERATHGTLLSEFNYTEEVVIEPAPADDPDAEPVTETVTHRVGDITIYIDSTPCSCCSPLRTTTPLSPQVRTSRAIPCSRTGAMTESATPTSSRRA